MACRVVPVARYSLPFLVNSLSAIISTAHVILQIGAFEGHNFSVLLVPIRLLKDPNCRSLSLNTNKSFHEVYFPVLKMRIIDSSEISLNFLPWGYKTLHSRRELTSLSPPWETYILQIAYFLFIYLQFESAIRIYIWGVVQRRIPGTSNQVNWPVSFKSSVFFS
jgi:hypothetical protein